MASLQSEIDSLLKLLTDDSRFVSEAAAHRLYELAEDEEAYRRIVAATDGDDLILQLRARGILDRRRSDDYQHRFEQAVKVADIDLEEGCKLIASEDYYTPEVESISKTLNDMAGELRPRYEAADTDDARAALISSFLFDDKGFRGNRENYYALDNSFLNRVIETRCGIPITLGVVMILLGRRLGFTFHPISVPTHFLVHYGDDFETNFLDPFNGGRRLTRHDCFDFLKRVGVVPHPSHLEPASTRHLMARMLRNLAAIYHQAQSHAHAAVIEQRITWLTDH